MEQNNNNTTPEVEVVETSVVETPQTPATEKALTQDQVNSIVAKVRETEAVKAEATTKELQERLDKLEQERAAEKAEAELREKILKETTATNKAIKLETLVSSKVKETYKENVIKLAKMRLGDLSDKSDEQLSSAVEEVVNSMPSEIAIGTSNTQVLASVETVPAQVQTPQDGEKAVYTLGGQKANISLEDFEKLPEWRKVNYTIK